MKIIINVPKNKTDKWIYSVNGKVKRYRASVNTLLQSIESALVMASSKEKTCVRVKYDTGYYNESIASLNALQQLWYCACFLEDYLSKRSFRQIEKRFLSWILR